ncbi:hypothetical protein [Paenibacillus sp. FSL R7-0331]|uniref:hypothetical protein n=1 Tax=Paenibacillus sp. FSL R7-0331 TaxID=1536773 RepID=UPI000ADB083F|nr:hypothetical protein [Paenibacillus sp. FSL R7-0331]
MFAGGILSVLTPAQRTEVLDYMEQELKPRLFHWGVWIMDYRRIRVAAVKR